MLADLIHQSSVIYAEDVDSPVSILMSLYPSYSRKKALRRCKDLWWRVISKRVHQPHLYKSEDLIKMAGLTSLEVDILIQVEIEKERSLIVELNKLKHEYFLE